jgi:ComF family protein
MHLLDALLSSVAPHECLGCGSEGRLLCQTCADGLTAAVARCYRCHALDAEAMTCASCRRQSHLLGLRAACLYQGAAKGLIWQLKLAGARAAAEQMAGQMVLRLPPVTAATMLVPVPTATNRIRRRGYDQATLLATTLARKARLRCISCLSRTTQTEQHGSSRLQRLQQLSTAFRVTRGRPLQGQDVILVDDVVTTGATLEAAAAVLQAAGARRIDAVVFAQA